MQVLWIVSALGTSCWPLCPILFLFGVGCAGECGVSSSQFVFLLLQRVFLNNITVAPFSLPVKPCSRWGDRAQCTATGCPGNLCPPSKNMFWPSVPHLVEIFTTEAILFCKSMTQYSWQVLFAHPAKAKHILLKWKHKKKGHAHQLWIKYSWEWHIGTAKRPDWSYL